jgi:hypothetical protein
MALQRIHSFRVHAAKHDEEPPGISGTQIPRRGPLYTMLSRVFS